MVVRVCGPGRPPEGVALIDDHMIPSAQRWYGEPESVYRDRMNKDILALGKRITRHLENQGMGE
jgi:hypothetical protein